LKNALQEYTSIPYKDWIIKQAGQITLLVSQINFNIQVISCFDTKNPAEALGKYYSDLINTINMAASVMSKELSNDKTLTIEALLTIEVHSRDTLTDLIKNKVT
jgi:dynein heavy chain